MLPSYSPLLINSQLYSCHCSIAMYRLSAQHSLDTLMLTDAPLLHTPSQMALAALRSGCSSKGIKLHKFVRHVASGAVQHTHTNTSRQQQQGLPPPQQQQQGGGDEQPCQQSNGMHDICMTLCTRANTHAHTRTHTHTHAHTQECALSLALRILIQFVKHTYTNTTDFEAEVSAAAAQLVGAMSQIDQLGMKLAKKKVDHQVRKRTQITVSAFAGLMKCLF